MNSNETKAKPKNERVKYPLQRLVGWLRDKAPLRIVAVVEMNGGEALVLNRSPKFLYEQKGKDFIGIDGPFVRCLGYSKASKGMAAFAGSELTLPMRDGSTKKIKDHWWSGNYPGFNSVSIGTRAQLAKCYVFSGGICIEPDALARVRSKYTGPVIPYWEYEKTLKKPPNACHEGRFWSGARSA